MRDRTKWVIALAALAVVGGAHATARAGNLSLPTCEYYSVLVHPGDSFHYTGSESNVVLTVDDITYTVQINPCDLTERCEFFSMADMGGTNGTLNGSSSAFGVDSAGGNFTTTAAWVDTTTSFVGAKGQYLRLEMSEGTGPGQVFDAVSHSVYGTMFDKTHDRKEGGATVTTYGNYDPWLTLGGAVQSSSGGTATSTEAMGISTWAVQTSESRHYQSPQVFQQTTNNRVWLTDATSTGFGVYNNSYATVKGRVYFGTEDAPVENFDVTAETP